jgi:hypothetical protein
MVDIPQPGRVIDDAFTLGQDAGAHHRQDGVFGAGHLDPAGDRVAALNYKFFQGQSRLPSDKKQKIHDTVKQIDGSLDRG